MRSIRTCGVQRDRASMTMQRILHSDRGAFVGNAEARRRPEPYDRPVMVGGDPGTRRVWPGSDRWRARLQGPLGDADRPGAPPVSPGRVSRSRSRLLLRPPPGRRAILRDLSPAVAVTSLDEPHLDATKLAPISDPPGGTATTINAPLRGDLGLTASSGVAHHKMLGPASPIKTRLGCSVNRGRKRTERRQAGRARRSGRWGAV